MQSDIHQFGMQEAVVPSVYAARVDGEAPVLPSGWTRHRRASHALSTSMQATAPRRFARRQRR